LEEENNPRRKKGKEKKKKPEGSKKSESRTAKSLGLELMKKEREKPVDRKRRGKREGEEAAHPLRVKGGKWFGIAKKTIGKWKSSLRVGGIRSRRKKGSERKVVFFDTKKKKKKKI